jgi:hypothetical protein
MAQSKKNDISVIALDPSASAKLHKNDISHQTPLSYLNLSYNDDALTGKAVAFAKTWYEPFGQSLSYKGISLGEVVEYDFVFLFNDAVRSIEIAEEIMKQVRPDEIVLPCNTTFDAPNTTCYEALSPALLYLATLNGIKTTVIRPNPFDKLEALAKSSKESSKRLARFFIFRLGQMRAQRSKKSTRSDTHKKTILLQHIPAANAIEREIDSNNALCYSTDLTVVTDRRPKKLTRDLAAAWEDYTKSPRFVMALKYKAVPLYQVLEYRFVDYFSFRLPSLAKLCENMQKNIKALNPDIMVLMEDVSPPNRLLGKICQGQGIPVLVIQHGAVSGDMGGFHVMPLEANKQAVWGEISQEWHVVRGKDIESQVITGNYRFDPIAKEYAVNEDDVRRQLRINNHKGVIVLATAWYAGTSVLYTWEMNEQLIRKALHALKPYNDKQIVVKLHPNHYERYKRIVLDIANEVGIDAILTKDYLWELLNICDLLICGNSTVGIEAMFFAKPVIMINLDNALEIPFASYDAAICVHTQEEIESAIDIALHDSTTIKKLALNQERFLRDYTYKRDGQASRRVARLIMDMAN